MAEEYSVEVCNALAERFRSVRLHRPMRVCRYDAGAELVYQAQSVENGGHFGVRLVVEKFVGGGFAGQVYRVKVLDIEPGGELRSPLDVGGIYAIKILIPPSNVSRFFRDVLYAVGFQGPFQLQVNPAAARAGALWQKFIRRAAQMRFGDESAVADIRATFVDERLGSCGEFSEWVAGRTWRLEVDEHLDTLARWRKGKKVDEQKLGSAEYRAKKLFMAEFVKMLHDMGAYEFARQYEWTTCKSQPNCLKRFAVEGDAGSGLTAVDFRAGLALLPIFPMSPGDFKLIAGGLRRGSLVQFDRGSIKKLEAFVRAGGAYFSDMTGMLEELKKAEAVYRDSLPDITHNHIRLLYSGRLWSTIFSSAITGWKVRGLIDPRHEAKLRESSGRTFLFLVAGIIPFLGKILRKGWGRSDWRSHYKGMLTSGEYLERSIRGRLAEIVTGWYRAGRVEGGRAGRIADSPIRFLCHLLLSLLPAGLHRFVTDWRYAGGVLAYIMIRPIRLYFNAELREKWLLEMVSEGQNKHILSEEDTQVILSQIKEPFIQKYLQCLAVHLSTLFVTEATALVFAAWYVLSHPDMPWAQAWGSAIGIIALFQVLPVSPGSLVRGFYVLYLVIRERNLKDYNIALVWGFFRYIGYLAFPIQMAYRYPALARFMAGHWATEAVHIVPVFGERGALLEHWVFNLFYNWPLTIRRRMRNLAKIRSAMKPRYWHIVFCAIAGAGVFFAADYLYLKNSGLLPRLRDIWWLVLAIPLCLGAVVTLGCGGAVLWRRILAATATGALTGLIYTGFSAVLRVQGAEASGEIWLDLAWRLFVFSFFSLSGGFVTEVKQPDPDLG